MTMEKLQADMIAAMKARDKVRKETISTLISAVKKVAIDSGNREEIPESMVDTCILKELKSVKEQIETCPASRDDLKSEYTQKYDIINEYAPKLMDEGEVKAFITEKFPELVASKNKGMIMKSVMAELQGKADGTAINQVVAELCK